jgi:hypothetical protein
MVTLIFVAALPAHAAAPCDVLRRVRLANTTIVAVTLVDSGKFVPVTRCNGSYLGVGNGTFGGSINYYRLGEALHSGYATSSTDTGHRGAPSDTATQSLFKALEQWVENGVPPEAVTAIKFAVDGDPASGVVQTRTLHPYPR